MSYDAALSRLREIDSELNMISHIAAVLSWDQETVPPAGAEERAVQMGWVETRLHEMITSDEMGSLLTSLGASEEHGSGDPSLDEHSSALVRILFTEWNRQRKLDASFVREFAELTGRAHRIWAEARQADDFSQYAPTLERIVEMVREKSRRFGYVDDPYDPLIDRFEPGTTTAEVAQLFAAMKKDLLFVLDALKDRRAADDAFLYQKYAQDKMEQFNKEILETIGFDFNRGVIGISTHPFTTKLGADDIRLTIRYTEPNVTSSMFTAIHEGGHALYEQGSSNPVTRGSSLAGGTSLAFHESQSRLWENIIGRSKAFWIHFFPKLKTLFPTQLNQIDVDSFLKGINKVEPSFIRVNADEVTYGMHIILRFELERALLTGQLAVKDLPDAWNEKMVKLLGIRPKNFREGVLQDIHWSMGELGYFPTYALGNLYGAQIFDAMSKEIDVDALIASGQMQSVKEWLNEHVYTYGSVYKPKDLLVKVTGKPLDSSYFANYLKTKYIGGGMA